MLKKVLLASALAGSLAGGTYYYTSSPTERVSTARVLDDGDPGTPPLPHSVELRVMSGATLLASETTRIDGDVGPCGRPRNITPLENPILNGRLVVFNDPYDDTKDCEIPTPMPIPDGSGYQLIAVYHADCPVLDEGGMPTGDTTDCVSTAAMSQNILNVQTTDPCEGAVFLDVGDWTRQVPLRGPVRVQFSLMRSRDPVIKLELATRPTGASTFSVTDQILAQDLRKVAGVYFNLPTALGRYDIRLTALTAGCSDGSTRPMVVEVTP